jgi:methionyl-tRNA formyltransferase
VKPRVIAFVNGPLGDQAISIVAPYLVAVVANQNPERYANGLSAEVTTAEMLKEYKPTHGVSVGYRSIIPKSIIDVFPHGIVNVHTSLLPYGRGAHPNAWALAHRHPAGVTLHLIDAGVDTGPILYQTKLEVQGHDTAKTLHEKLQQLAWAMMQQHLPPWLQTPGIYRPKRQGLEFLRATMKSDLESLSLGVEAEPVIDILRARTFPPYPGALYTDRNGKRYRVRIEMEEDMTEQPIPAKATT